MLGKLIKYDFQSSYREFLGVFAAFLLSFFFGCLLILLPESILTAFFPLLMIILIIIAIVLAFLSIFKIYTKRIYSAEGYLTNALPVRGVQIMSSKLLVTSVWIIATGACLALLVIGLLLVSASHFDRVIPLSEILLVMKPFLQGWFPVLLVLSLFLSVVNSALSLFLACSLAYQRAFRKLRVLAGIGMYYVVNFLEGLVSLGITFLFVRQDLFTTVGFTATDTADLIDAFPLMNKIMLSAVLSVAIVMIIKFFVTSFLLEKKLELE